MLEMVYIPVEPQGTGASQPSLGASLKHRVVLFPPALTLPSTAVNPSSAALLLRVGSARIPFGIYK